MSDTLIYPLEGMKRDAEAIKAHSSHYIVWYKNNLDIADPHGVEFADLVTADFPGYSNQPVSFGAVSENADGNAQMTSTTATVTRTLTGTGQTIYGWALCHFDGSTLRIRRLVKWATAITLDTNGQQLFATATIIQGECPP